MKEYVYERLSGENLHNLIFLYQECFNVRINLDFLKKKYNTAPFGAAYVGYIAFEKETREVAGYYGVFPVLAKTSMKRNLLIAQSGDTMTHPRHQGRGLFTSLARMTYSLAGKEGINFVFGFPNENSYPGFKKKLKWEFYHNINHYAIKTGGLPFDKLFKKVARFYGMYEKFFRNKLKDYLVQDTFGNSLERQSPDHGFILHDEVFFKYKTFYPSYTIKINKVLCVVKIDGRLWVGDVEYCSRETFIDIVDELILLAKRIGCSSVHFSVSEGTSYDNILKERFEVKSKIRAGYLNITGTVDPSEFVYQALDFDTY
jgi:hypothetical protein